MPIYEYRCSRCDNRIEVLQKADDPPPQACYVCDNGRMEKQLSSTSFHLKGKGWYETDFK